MGTKCIQIDKFSPCGVKMQRDGSYEGEEFWLETLFLHMKQRPLTETKRDIFGEPYCIYKLEHDPELNIWEVQMLHVREALPPGVLSDDGAFSLIRLGKDEELAESTTLLYDVSSKELHMQRNAHGVSIRGLEAYFGSFLGADNITVNLKVLLNDNTMDRVSHKAMYRKVVLVGDTSELQNYDAETPLAKVMRGAIGYDGPIVSVGLGFGRKYKDGFLNHRKTLQLLKEAYTWPGTQTLKVSASESTDTAVETIDLLKDRDVYQFKMNFSKESPITHDKIFYLCRKKFKEHMEANQKE